MTYVKLQDAVKAVEALWNNDPNDTDYVEGLQDSIKALRSLPTDDGWGDIATAPRDGSEILLYTDTSKSDAETKSYVESICEGEHVKRVQIGYWCDLQAKWEKPIIGDPLFWRPLPAPPAC